MEPVGIEPPITKADARRFLDRVGADMQQGRWVDPSLGRMLLSDWADMFLETATELDPNTRFTYRRDLTRNILPRFGSRALSAIRRSTSGCGWPTSWGPASLRARSTGTTGSSAGC